MNSLVALPNYELKVLTLEVILVGINSTNAAPHI